MDRMSNFPFNYGYEVENSNSAGKQIGEKEGQKNEEQSLPEDNSLSHEDSSTLEKSQKMKVEAEQIEKQVKQASEKKQKSEKPEKADTYLKRQAQEIEGKQPLEKKQKLTIPSTQSQTSEKVEQLEVESEIFETEMVIEVAQSSIDSHVPTTTNILPEMAQKTEGRGGVEQPKKSQISSEAKAQFSQGTQQQTKLASLSSSNKPSKLSKQEELKEEIKELKKSIEEIEKIEKTKREFTHKLFLSDCKQKLETKNKELEQLTANFEDRLLPENHHERLTLFCNVGIFTVTSPTLNGFQLKLQPIVVNSNPGEGTREVYTTFALVKLFPILDNLESQMLKANFRQHCSCVGLASLLIEMDKETTTEKEKIKLHAQVRLQLFHSMCQCYYKSQTTVIQSVAATTQVGKGNKTQGTAACHHSLLANVKDNFSEQLQKSVITILRKMRNDSKIDFDFPTLLLLKALNINIQPTSMINLSNHSTSPVQLNAQVSGSFGPLRASPLRMQNCLFNYFNNTTLIAHSLVNEVDSLIETKRDDACNLLIEVAKGKLTPILATQMMSTKLISYMEKANSSLTGIAEGLKKIKSFSTIETDEDNYNYIKAALDLLKYIEEWDGLTRQLHVNSPLRDQEMGALMWDLKRIKREWDKKSGSIGESIQGKNLNTSNSELLKQTVQDIGRLFQNNQKMQKKIEDIQECLQVQLEGTKAKQEAYQQITHDEDLAINEQIILLSHCLEIVSLRQSSK